MTAKTQWTVKTVCEAFWRLEAEYGLLDRSLHGVKVWQLIRMPLYYMVTTRTGVFTTPHSKSASFFGMLKRAGIVLNLATKNPLRGRYTKDTLVFDHSRKVNVDGEFIDIYTAPLLKTMVADDFDVIEAHHEGLHYSAPSANRHYLDVVTIGSFAFQKTRRIRFSPQDTLFIERVEKDVNQTFGISIDLKALFSRYIKHFQFSFSFYSRLFKKRQPKRIFCVVSYSYFVGPLIAAAKAQGIETIEIQHGTLSPYHLGYSFPGRKKELDYFPSTFWAFGEYWKTAAQFPLPAHKMVTYGFPHFVSQKKAFESVQKKSKQILFISQGVIGESLAQFVLECARKLPDYDFVYKLHPGEYSRWRDDYPALVEASTLPNVEVVDHHRRNLHEYFAESAYQVGVFSTAIFEGLSFACRTFIVDLPGVEYMRKLIEDEIVLMVKTPHDLVLALNESTFPAFESDHFFFEPKT